MTTDKLGLVSINKKADGSTGMSRRSFLKVLGSASAVGAVGCAENKTQNIFPYAKPENEQIPGVALWYRSTCREWSAGCGIQVRTREGRAVNVEGNPDHPVNKGGLCGLGQSALQSLYDPDRVRQPLERTGSKQGVATWRPITWAAAYAKIGEALGAKGKKVALVTGENTGAMAELLSDWAKSFDAEHVVYDALQPIAVAKASELVFGTYGIPTYRIDKADAIVNFGADFLETFVSPCEYARGWSVARKREKPVRIVHVEPRLSLTGANADTFLRAHPGSEIRFALAILKELFESGRGENLSGDVRSQIRKLVAGVRVADVALETGIPTEKILLAIEILKSAQAPLVLAGGATNGTNEPLPLLVVAGLINLVLGAVGQTVDIGAMRTPRTSPAKVAALVESLKKSEVGVLFVHGTNPAFSLPLGVGFKYAIRNAGLKVSFSSHLDETAAECDLILPANTSLESWGDDRPTPGVNSLMQPTMQAVFDTRPFGDMLLDIAAQSGRSGVGGGAKNFEEFLKASWKGLNPGGDFTAFWLAAVERGGYFAERRVEPTRVSVGSGAFKIETASRYVAPQKGELALLAYASVKGFDGRAANRPWLQELPDPITKVVWDSWAEIHPETAKKFGVAQGDMVTARNEFGEVTVPAYVTDLVHRDIIAVPMGQGHVNYGRYAQAVGGGNVIDLIPAKFGVGADSLVTMGAAAQVSRARGQAKTVILQGHDYQLGRDLARSKFVAAGTAAGGAAAAAHGDSHGGGDAYGGGHGGGHGAGHHEPKQMYVQREHPLYAWGMAIDLNACTGCSACVVACYAENNIPVVGKEQCWKGREMSWLRIERYYDGSSEELQVNFQPMMCQHCNNAPCEPVCPVYATYHNDEGLNAMIYNRCVGTRYCSNNCSYKVRRFNWFEYDWASPMDWQLNPDVTKRTMGIMEKCTFCVQRITEAKDHAKDLGRMVEDGEVQPACVQSCPTQAIVFGNRNDPNSRVSKASHDERAYKVLDHHLNTQPAVSYLERVRYKNI